MTITVEQRIDLAATALAEGRIIQNSWRRNGNDGRKLVCALAAFGPDINKPENCPADLMPAWLAELVPVLDDGIATADVPWFMTGLIDRARQWHVLDADAWERVRVGFTIAVVQQALASAEKAQPVPKPEYWSAVADAAAAVVEALRTGDPERLKAARSAAAAARSAAYKIMVETLCQMIDAELALAKTTDNPAFRALPNGDRSASIFPPPEPVVWLDSAGDGDAAR